LFSHFPLKQKIRLIGVAQATFIVAVTIPVSLAFCRSRKYGREYEGKAESHHGRDQGEIRPGALRRGSQLG
jgi:hypothetical protein